jgi:hypothetical protein
MGRDVRDHVDYVIGPEGYKLMLQNLPLANTSRCVGERPRSCLRCRTTSLASVRPPTRVEEFAAWQHGSMASTAYAPRDRRVRPQQSHRTGNFVT